MKLKLCTALITAATIFAPLSLAAEKALDRADTKRAAAESYGRLPLSFEPTENASIFLAHSGTYAVSVGARESSVAVNNAKSGKTQTLRFAFDRANAAATLGAMEPQPGVTNYYIGKDASQWRLGVKNYAKLRAKGIYPGVDVVYYGDHRRLEFDFVVAPKADPSVIAVSFAGMERLYQDASGDLIAEVGGQPVRFAKPVAYQKVDGSSKNVAVDYELASNGKVHLRIGAYDRSRELIVDPVVSYATYLGGSLGDVANGIAVDNQGNAYITGQTCSSNFPGISNGTFEGACDAFVTKLSPDGLTLSYTTILGGAVPAPGLKATLATAQGYGIAVDNSTSAFANYAYVVGTSNIEDMPGNTGGYRNGYQGGDSDAFIAILRTDGSLLRTTYLGGRGADAGYGIAIDQAVPPNISVVGQTCSDDFPGYNAFETKVEACVAFVTKLDNTFDFPHPIAPFASALSPTPIAPAGQAYYFSEFYGGQPVAPFSTGGAWAQLTSYPQGALVVDNQNPPNIQRALNSGTSGPYVPATTTIVLPIPNWNTTIKGNTIEGSMTWENLGPANQLPPNAFSEAYGVAIDPPGDVFLTGGTNTASLASTLWQCSPAGTGAWVLKVSGTDGSCRYAWALENSPTDVTSTIDTARAIAVDSSGRAYVVGTMKTGALPKTSNAFNTAAAGDSDAFLVRVNTAGSAIDYATYLGGSGKDQGLGVAVDSSFQAYVTGGTQSIDFPVINPLQNPSTFADLPLNGTEGAFVAKFTLDGSALIFSSYLGGSQTDQGNAIAVAPNAILDPSDVTNTNMYVVGNTSSPDLLTTLLTQPMVAPSYVPPQASYGTNGDPGDAFVAMIPGAGIPTVTVSPGTLNFPNQDVNTTSATALPVFYTIEGNSAVNIKTITFSNGEFGQKYVQATGGNSGDCTNSTPIAPPGCTLWVVFTPTAQNKQTGTLTITDSASSKPHTINLIGTGAVPVDTISAVSVAFGNQIVSTSSAVHTVSLKNIGLGILDISGVTIAGDFSLDATTTCGGGQQLAPGSSCIVAVIFTPSGTGLRTGSVTITDDAAGSPHAINLQGTGVGVTAPTIAPTSLTFANQALNSTSSVQPVTLTNTSAASLNIGSILISGTNAGDFAQSNNCGALLLGNGSCIINVTFTPTVLGGRTASLVFTDSATNSPQTIPLNGSGIAATGTISLSATTVAFGSQSVGTTSTSQTVTLTNSSSTSALSITNIGVTGTNAADFAQTNSCPPLAPGASCQIKVTFTPSLAGAESAALTVVASASNSPQSVSLTGTGLAVGTGGSGGTAGPFTVTPAAMGVSIIQGGTAVYSFSVAPQNGFNSSITFTCSGPKGSSCSVTPNPLVMDGTTVPTVKLFVSTTGGNGVNANLQSGAKSIFFALLPFTMIGMLLTGKRRGIGLLLALLLVCLAFGLVGCGSSNSATTSGLAPGSYQVTVTAASGGTTPATQTIALGLVVNKQ